MSNVLIADHNREKAYNLAEYVKKEGYDIYYAENGNQAIKIFSERNYDMVLINVNIPVIDGFSLCKIIRETSNIPVILINDRNDDYEKIIGLNIGADDYIVRPCLPDEIVARMRAITRRIYFEHISNAEEKPNILKIGDLIIDIDNFSVSVNGKKVLLTRKEIEILKTLAENKGKVFTRENLLNSLWGYEYYGDCRTVDSHIKRLRAKLNRYPHSDWKISTIWGVGYKFEIIQNLKAM